METGPATTGVTGADNVEALSSFVDDMDIAH